MTTKELQAEALGRATTNAALTNYPAIFQGFMKKGLLEDDIKPRVNVFTFHAWKALGRSVRKGEHGVRVVTWADRTTTDPETGETVNGGKFCRATTVFHVSQTEPSNA